MVFPCPAELVLIVTHEGRLELRRRPLRWQAELSFVRSAGTHEQTRHSHSVQWRRSARMGPWNSALPPQPRPTAARRPCWTGAPIPAPRACSRRVAVILLVATTMHSSKAALPPEGGPSRSVCILAQALATRHRDRNWRDMHVATDEGPCVHVRNKTINCAARVLQVGNSFETQS